MYTSSDGTATLEFVNGKIGIVILSGAADYPMSLKIENTLSEHVGGKSNLWVIDFKEVNFVDTEFIKMLLRLLVRAKEFGGNLVFVHLNGPPRRIVELAGLTSVVKSLDNRDEGLKFLREKS